MRIRRQYRNGWTVWHAVAAAVLVAACAVVAGDAWADLAGIGWRDEESSHVLLVPLVVFWLAWVRRGRFRLCEPGGRVPGMLLMACGALMWALGYRDQIQSCWHLGAILLTVGGLLTAVGQDVLVRFLPAFVVLAFLVPVPNTARQWIALPLQHATAQMTQNVCEVLGMSVLRQGNLLTVNGREVAIAEACNGMRMVFTLFLGCYVFAFVTPLRGYVRALVLLASPLVAVVANVARLVPTVWVFGHAGHDFAESFHTASGWLMLVLAFLALTGIVRLLRWATVPVAPFTLAAAC